MLINTGEMHPLVGGRITLVVRRGSDTLDWSEQQLEPLFVVNFVPNLVSHSLFGLVLHNEADRSRSTVA